LELERTKVVRLFGGHGVDESARQSPQLYQLPCYLVNTAFACLNLTKHRRCSKHQATLLWTLKRYSNAHRR